MSAEILEEKCERCGWLLAFVDMLALTRQIAGVDESTCSTPNPGPEWCEIHQRDGGGTTRLALQEHTAERCDRIRSGDPEPFEWSDDDDDLDEDDDW